MPGMANTLLIAVLGTVCVTTLLAGTGSIIPVSGVVGGIFDLVAIVTGIFIIGLLEGR
jgi:hypothetical protein